MILKNATVSYVGEANLLKQYGDYTRILLHWHDERATNPVVQQTGVRFATFGVYMKTEEAEQLGIAKEDEKPIDGAFAGVHLDDKFDVEFGAIMGVSPGNAQRGGLSIIELADVKLTLKECAEGSREEVEADALPW